MKSVRTPDHHRQRMETNLSENTKSYVIKGATDLAPGEVTHVKAGNVEIALCNIGGKFYAMHDECSHMKARLSDGYLDGEVIQCPLHFGKFNVLTGEAVSPPCKVPVKTYPVEIDGGAVMVLVPA